MAFWDGTRWVPESEIAPRNDDGETARPRSRIASLAAIAVFVLGLPSVTFANTSSISGLTFQDVDRDGVHELGEPVLADQEIHLFDGRGTYVSNTRSDAAGTYAFTDLPSGDYRVAYSTAAWRTLRRDWVPTTTGSIQPRVDVALAGIANVDFGWREIVRSRDVGEPISTHVGPSGLRVESFNDVIPAEDLYDAAMRGTVGGEAASTTIRFDFSESSSAAISYQGSPGTFRSFKAALYVNWIGWLLQGDAGLGHEYGHAWTEYHDKIVQQDGKFALYLSARGLLGDARVNSSYLWNTNELIAEDYRQLLGSPDARTAPQANAELPLATEVPGLKAFLLETFAVPPSPDQPPAPEPTPIPEPSASATPDATPAPEPPPSPMPDPTAEPSTEPPLVLDVADPTVNPAPVVDSGTVTSSITADATITIEIRTARGQLVRKLLAGVFEPAGSVAATWDRRDARGKRVKAGTYVAVVVAVAPDGTSVRRTSSFIVL